MEKNLLHVLTNDTMAKYLHNHINITIQIIVVSGVAVCNQALDRPNTWIFCFGG